MFWASLLRLAIGVKCCLYFAGCAIAQLHGERRQKCMYGKTDGRENEKSTTRGIPRWSPIQVLTLTENFRDRTRTGAFPVVWS